MATVRQFLLIGEACNHSIHTGDRIEILDAYHRSALQIALADTFSINGEERKFGIPSICTLKLNRTGPIDGEIIQLYRIGKDLLITVSERPNSPQSTDPRRSQKKLSQ